MAESFVAVCGMSKSEPNPNWVEAPYEATVWTPETGVVKITERPKLVDGEYANADGVVTMIVKDGVVQLASKNDRPV